MQQQRLGRKGGSLGSSVDVVVAVERCGGEPRNDIAGGGDARCALIRQCFSLPPLEFQPLQVIKSILKIYKAEPGIYYNNCFSPTGATSTGRPGLHRYALLLNLLESI